MLKIFNSLKEKDEKAINNYKLDSSILMEIAARGLKEKIVEIAYKNEKFYRLYKKGFCYNIPQKKTIQIVCGTSDNGGDGLVLSRILQDEFNVITSLPFSPKSYMCKLQKERLDLLGIKVQENVTNECDILVDALFGTGFKGEVKSEYVPILKKMNEIKAYKIALDVPSALDIEGVPQQECFRADKTISIGALRYQLFSSLAKDYVGSINLVRLPLPNAKYEEETNMFFLQKEDIKMPHRKLQNVNKGTFGHIAIIQGEKAGASQLVAGAALAFGAGLVTICGENAIFTKPDYMVSKEIPENINCIAIGQGLGRLQQQVFNTFLQFFIKHKEISLVLDADVFFYREISFILENAKNVVLTPHPKEFCVLLKNTIGIQTDVENVRKEKRHFMNVFCNKYPNTILLLKDCNTFIGKENNIYINAFGSSSLAKGGTGDVLTGLIASLLAQGYSPLNAAIVASMSHAIASHKIKNDYALTATSLIKSISKIKI